MSDVTTPAAPEGASLDTGDGYTIQSTDKSASQIQEALDSSPKPRIIKPIPDKPKEKEPPDASTAAAVLGRKGGEAAAKARKAAQRESVDPGERELEGTGGDSEGAGVSAPVETAGEPLAEDEPEETKGIRSESIKQRIREATARAAEAKRERDYWRAEAERVRQEREAQRQPPQEPQQAQNKRALPFKPEEFETYEDYLDARDEYRRQEWEYEQRSQAQIDAYAQQLDGYFSTYREKMSKAFNGDFESRVSEEVRNLRVSAALDANERIGPDNIIADEIVCCENPAAVSLYLSDHPDELQRLMTLPSPQHIAREIMKIEAKAEGVTAGTPPPGPRPLSQAKPPVRPVTASPPVSELTGEESYDEHVAKMNARERRQRR